jgi:hypothetical protein
MKKNFDMPLAPKNQEPPYTPKDGKKEPFWDFRAPQYDQRHSCFINAGTSYGTGYAQPCGSMGAPKMFVPALPVNTCKEIPLYNGPE